MKRVKLFPSRLAALVAVSAALALAPGCGGGGGGGSSSATDTQAPAFTRGEPVLPSGFTFVGGTVTLYADVSDDVGVTSVQYALKHDGVVLSQGAMTRVSGNTYRSTCTAPSNSTTELLRCDVVVAAYDAAGHTSYRNFSFSVPTASGGPPPPPVMPE